MSKQGLHANVITYNATISACEKGRQWQRALGLLEERSSQGLQANVITYSATINACEKGRQWQRALGLLKEMLSLGLQADVITYAEDFADEVSSLRSKE